MLVASGAGGTARKGACLQVLVASDAVGMGVNLNIRRIIFHTLTKYDPRREGMGLLPPAEVKQIAGKFPWSSF